MNISACNTKTHMSSHVSTVDSAFCTITVDHGGTDWCRGLAKKSEDKVEEDESGPLCTRYCPFREDCILRMSHLYGSNQDQLVERDGRLTHVHYDRAAEPWKLRMWISNGLLLRKVITESIESSRRAAIHEFCARAYAR